LRVGGLSSMMYPMSRFAPTLVVVAALIAAPSAFADAVVTNGNDSGAGSFRAALAAGGRITFAGSYETVADDPLVVSTPVDIVGPDGYFPIRHPVGWGGGPPLLDFASGSSGSTVTGVEFWNTPDDAGVKVENGVTGVKITNSPMCNVNPPIELLGAGTAVPTELKAGPRRPDGTVVFRGVAGAPGRLDLYRGPLGVTFIGECERMEYAGSENVAAAGPFTFILPSSPSYVTLTTASGTSEWAAVAVDVTPPELVGQPPPNTLNNRQLVVTPSEPLAPGSVQPSDFSLTMGGRARAITQARYDQHDNVIRLVSSQPWKPGQPGTIALARQGAIDDVAGNLSSDTRPITVSGLPAGFRTPALGRVSLKRGRHAGVTIRFTANEPGLALFRVYGRGHRLAGSFVKKVSRAGVQRIGWSGRVKRKRLRAGRYSLTVSMTDAKGNLTEVARHRSFRVRRSSR